MAGKRFIQTASGAAKSVPVHIKALDVIRSLREGDVLHVETAANLIDNRREMKAALAGLRRRKATAVADDTGTKTTDAYFAVEVLEGFHRRNYFMSPEEASRRAKIGSEKRKLRPMTKREALKIWRTLEYTGDEAAKNIGVATITAYRWLGPRGKPAGRPRKSRGSK